MAPATDAEPRRVASGCTSDHSAKMTPQQQAEFESRQAMASSYIASQYMEHQETINDSTEIDWNNGDELLILSQRSTRALKEARARAAMARPVSEDESVKVIKDKSVAIVDCGASSTLTGSLINATDIEEKVTIIETADGEERMRSSHKCIKTYFVRNRMGDPVPMWPLWRGATGARFRRGGSWEALPDDVGWGSASSSDEGRLGEGIL